MDTVTFTRPDGKTLDLPIAVGRNQAGFVFELDGSVAPENCDHAGACWSAEMAFYCPRCGVPMFMPPRYLAHRPAEVIDRMHELWQAAGWPHYAIGSDGWWTNENWTTVQHPLFAHVGGLPVRNDKCAGSLRLVARHLESVA